MTRLLAAAILIGTMIPLQPAAAEPVHPEAREVVGYILKIFDSPGANSTNPPQARYLGTAFAGSHTYPDGKQVQFLVTARHVVVDPRSGAPLPDLLAQFPDPSHSRANLTQLDPLRWIFHKNAEQVDIAIYPALPIHAQIKRIQSELWVTQELLTEKEISEGDEAFYTALLPHLPGRPLSYPAGSQTVEGLVDMLLPITRFGHLALVNESALYQGKHLVFLDADNMPGHSGAPVFLWATPSRSASQVVAGPRIFGLYGVVSNVLGWHQAMVFQETGVVPLDAQSGGVTGIVPVRYLREIIESDTARTAFSD